MNELVADKRSSRKTREGVVVSNGADKTIAVMIERRIRHPLYGKFIKKSVKIHAHDEKNEAQKGDRVRVMETRPLSRTKRWRLVDIIKH